MYKLNKPFSPQAAGWFWCSSQQQRAFKKEIFFPILPYFFSWNLELTALTSLARLASGIHVSLPSLLALVLLAVIAKLRSYVGTGDPDSGSHAYAVSTWPSKPPLHCPRNIPNLAFLTWVFCLCNHRTIVPIGNCLTLLPYLDMTKAASQTSVDTPDSGSLSVYTLAFLLSI